MVVGAKNRLKIAGQSTGTPPGLFLGTDNLLLEQQDRRTTRVICSLLALSIFGQQLAIPIIGVPLALILFWTCLLSLWVGGRIKLSTRRLTFGSTITVCIGVCFVGWLLLGGGTPSLFSLGYIAACWMPFLFVAPTNLRLAEAITATYIWTVGCLALVAVVQFVVQLAGGPFLDFVALLSQNYIIPGYVHRARLDIPGLGGYLIRANGMVFLEPSMASQFFALGAILALRRKPFLVPLFVSALLFTGSGTGIIALAVGIIGFAITGNARERVLSSLAVALGFILLSVTGLIETLFARGNEFQTDGSSASFRFIDPWDHLWRFIVDSPEALLTGLGPGGVSVTAAAYGPGVNYTFTPKLIIEYGVPLGLACSIAMVLFILSSSTLTLAARLVLLAMTFALSGALGQPASAILLWCLCQTKPTNANVAEAVGTRQVLRPPRSFQHPTNLGR